MFKEMYKKENETLVPSNQCVEETKQKMRNQFLAINNKEIDPKDGNLISLDLTKTSKHSKIIVKIATTAAALVVLCTSAIIFLNYKTDPNAIATPPTITPTIAPTPNAKDLLPNTTNSGTYKVEAPITCYTSLNEEKVAITFKNGILTINGKTFNVCNDMIMPIEDYFYLVDVNSYDSYLELVFTDMGPSNDPESKFYHYINGELIFLGTLESYVEDMKINHDGTLAAKIRVDILQTSYTNFTYKLDNGFTKVNQEFYDIPTPRVEPSDKDSIDKILVLKCDLPIYESNSRDAKQSVLHPQKVAFIQSDLSHWIQIEGLEDHTIGWFYFDDYSNVTDLGLMSQDVFDNLQFYD